MWLGSAVALDGGLRGGVAVVVPLDVGGAADAMMIRPSPGSSLLEMPARQAAVDAEDVHPEHATTRPLDLRPAPSSRRVTSVGSGQKTVGGEREASGRLL